jgi:hypothetical protein
MMAWKTQIGGYKNSHTVRCSRNYYTDKLAKTIFIKIVLLAAGFLAVFLYFCALAIGVMKG